LVQVGVAGKGEGEMKRFLLLVALTGFAFTTIPATGSDGQEPQKEEYQKQTEAKLKKFDRKMEEMKSRAADVKQESREEFNRQMDELKKAREAANRKLGELKTESAKSWEKTKAEMDAAMKDLRKRYDGVMSRFRDK
jgi:molecular chaperone DnaK (HSP70)